MTRVELRPILADTSSDDVEGMLVLSNNRLVGILVRLAGAEQTSQRGCWNLEAGFGPLLGHTPDPFDNLTGAEEWLERTLREERG
jgi:hypothetical protein